MIPRRPTGPKPTYVRHRVSLPLALERPECAASSSKVATVKTPWEECRGNIPTDASEQSESAMIPRRPTGPKPTYVRHRVSLPLALESEVHLPTVCAERPECAASSSKVATVKTPWEECRGNIPTYASEQSESSYFSIGGDTPKVQIAYRTLPGYAPRELVIERIRRQYLVLDLENLLAEKGIETNSLMPRHLNSTDPTTPASDNVSSPFLSLEIFDNEDYDCRTPEDWLALGENEGSPGRKPIPAKALLLKEDPTSPNPEYSWHLVGVLDYCKEKCQYLVQKVLPCSNKNDEEGQPDEKTGHGKTVNLLHGGSEHWVPRIRLLFKAEDPRIFAERIEFALSMRNSAEVQLLYSTSVDCMPIWEGNPSLGDDSLQRIKTFVQSACGFEPKIFERCIKDLEKEAKLEYDRIMNRMVFDKIVTKNSEEFSEISLPPRDAEYVPQNGCVPVPPFNFEKKQAEFALNSLLNRPEVISVLPRILSECHKITNMRLFNVTLRKPLRLDEFDLIQSQVQHEIVTYIQKNWVISLSNSIRTASDSLASGCSRNESYFTVFRLMKVVVFRMRNSLRSLVLDSLGALSDFLLEACHCVLPRPPDLVWGSDLISSPYKPKKTPLFYVDLVLDETGVHYSTPLEDFETSITKLFRCAIAVTHKVPQLYKFVMKKLVTMGSLLLEPMSFYEEEVRELEEKVRSTLIEAAMPLRAYAAEYEKHSDLHNLDLEAFKSQNAEQTPEEVTIQVKHHLEEMEKLQCSLPSSIDIGPFCVRVESVRQSLITKRKALANTLLENFALTLRKQTESASEKCNVISRMLWEKPNSIEELTEKREWMKQIPKQLKSYKEVLAKILLDFEVLEEFCYNISNEDLNKKWTAIWWPQRISQQMEAVYIQHEEDEKRFHKIQLADHNKFEEQLDSLQSIIAEFAGHADVDLAHEMANKVKRTGRQLKQCQTLALTYNTREHLLNLPVSNFDRLPKLVDDCQPFIDLWTTISDWLRWNEIWFNAPLSSIEAEQLDHIVTTAQKNMSNCIEQFSGNPDIQTMASEMLNKMEGFQPFSLLIQCLRNPGMKSYHWEMISERINIKVRPKANMNLTRYIELGLLNHLDEIARVAETAAKEYSIEQALEKMEEEWATVVFDVLPYKDIEKCILKVPDEIFQMLDDHIVKTQNLFFSPVKNVLEGRLNTWERKLRMTQEVLEEWLSCQRAWLTMEPICSSEGVKQQLKQGTTYKHIVRRWKNIMSVDFRDQNVIELCQNVQLLNNLKRCNIFLENVQKSVTGYLEEKRSSFPRFSFLPDVELLDILSQSEDPTAVQRLLHKCFENISQLQFESDLQITHVYSKEGERVKLSLPVAPVGNVDDWLSDLEKSIKTTLKDSIASALKDYSVRPHVEWVLSWPGQVVMASFQVFWTAEVSGALEKGDLADRLHPVLQNQLADLVQLMRGNLTKLQQAVLSSLIVIEVHAKDVLSKLMEEQVTTIDDFEWISQLRYYWIKEDLYIQDMNAEFLYGYEYLGNSSRLVVTPLTKRCYLALTRALNLKLGGGIAGPTGAGKTETVKDLGKALAVHTVVFNCADQLRTFAVRTFLKGLASSGAWACLDDIIGVDVEVLSVMAQQISTIQKAQQQQADHFVFEGVEIPLVPSCAIFFTMNSGHSTYTEMPGSLKALFRPVSLMIPDYAVIAEISLYSSGFLNAKALSKKIDAFFRFSFEQLGSQDHYNFGMRAVKTVISVAGNLRSDNPDMNEELICLQAIRDTSLAQFSQDDLELSSAILMDLFHEAKTAPTSYGILEQSLRNVCIAKNLKDVDEFINKCIQLYRTSVVRHGLMLVGPPASGKTKCYEVLGAALTALEDQPSTEGGVYRAVQISVINPTSISVQQLYGNYSTNSHDYHWKDGILPALLRKGAASVDKKTQWFILDGPLDPGWMDGLNSLLDDSKKLCLSSGEFLHLTDEMSVMFEAQDLAGASPATVSRCGLVYLEPSMLGLLSLTECWLKRVPEALRPYTEQMNSLFSRFLQDSVAFVRSSVKEVIPSLDSNLACSLLKLMDCFFCPYNTKEGEKPPAREKLDRLTDLIEPWFFFSLVWSVGATGDADSRQRFSAWLRSKMAEEQVQLPFPEDGLVYDYKLDYDDHEERKIQWVSWMIYPKNVVMNPRANYADIFVPTADTERTSFLMDLLLTNRKSLLCVGPAGAGKTLTMTNKLLGNMPAEIDTHALVFSASTSANQTQDYIESKLNKRRKGVLGPPVGKQIIIFIDDLNMPVSEMCGAQPPFELLRQWMEQGGWYDRTQRGTFNHLVDMTLACAMGSSGGGQNAINQRFTRHFHILSFNGTEDTSKTIFSGILGSWMGPAPEIQALQESLVHASIQIYTAVTSHLLPTPAKCHYTFNLRDLSKVFQGILMAEAHTIKDKLQLLRLWYHESCRVFQDRLVCASDRDWLNSLLKDCIQGFDCHFEDVVPHLPVLYGDFACPESDQNVYAAIEDKEDLAKVMELYVEDYNHSNRTRKPLVLFMDAIEHVCRISRILRQPLGHALLLGVHGSGRHSLTKLASDICGYRSFQIEVSKNYDQTEWRKDIKNHMFSAGLLDQKITFIFDETQIKWESFLEDICNILNSGDVPNLYTLEEQERILKAMRPVVEGQGQQPTEANLMAAYKRKVNSNFHLVLCMSPIGEAFRARLRQFPSLVKCCTIDWFDAWPEEALQAVAESFINGLPEPEVSPMTKKALTLACVKIHKLVARKSEQFQKELSRHNYITPKSYTELLKVLTDLTGCKKQELGRAQQRINTGLDKLCGKAEEVRKLQEEREMMQSLLEEAAKDVEVTMETICNNSAFAEKIRKSVQEEEANLSEKECFARTISANAQGDLGEALKVVDKALASLKSLDTNSLTEVQITDQLPRGVKLVLEAICIMKGIEPVKVPKEKPGTSFDDYLEPAKSLLQEPADFLESLYNYDKDNIPDDVIRSVQPYIDDEEFQPDSTVEASIACSSICQWVRAMYEYHFMVKAVEPKRQALQEAKEDLAATQQFLYDVKKKLATLEESNHSLQAKYQECLAKKEDLDNKYQLTEAQLVRAKKLVDGLAEEEELWKETGKHLDRLVHNLAGDMLLCAGYVTYLGPFSISGLPKDTFSLENSIIAQYSLRWPLFIDPQGQANKWIKTMERENDLRVLRLSDSNYLQGLKNALVDGKPCLLENVGEELDPAIKPLLLLQTFEEESKTVLRLGDWVVPFSEGFKLYITTKLPNPHYSPEVSDSITLINFTVSPSGLEEQLLSLVVTEELPDLEEAKNQLVITNAKMALELKEIQDEILSHLGSAEGNSVAEDLNPELEASKIKAGEIKAKMLAAKKTEQDIDATRLRFSPVAERAQILFFCVSELSNLDPTYQYTLEWFLGIFMAAVGDSDPADTVEKRISDIKDGLTFSLYRNVCRSLFEKHKVAFALSLCARIMMNEKKIKPIEWRFLLSGGKPVHQLPCSVVAWVSDRAWQNILELSALDDFGGLAESFTRHLQGFRRIVDSKHPHREPLPGEWDSRLNSFQKLLVLRCLRPDCLIYGVQDFVSAQLGQRYTEPQMSDLSVIFKESSPTNPIILILSTGTDPAADIYKLADAVHFTKKVIAVSLGQGQVPLAEAMMRTAMKTGQWIIFQNCHMAPDWLPTLEQLPELISPVNVDKDFRLWLTSIPFKKIPVSILQNGAKMVIEPPRGIRARLERAYLSFTDELMSSSSKESQFKPLLLSLCLFHGVALERRRFGPLGFNIPYDFTEEDLHICVSQLKTFVDEYQDIPYKVLKHTAGEVNYGGHLTDNWDRRCLLTLLEDFYCPAVLGADHVYSGVYRQVDSNLDIKGYLAYIRGLPINDTPEIFGLHDNANIRSAQNETFALLEALVCLEPQVAARSAGDKTFHETVEEVVVGIVEKLPQPFCLQEVTEKYPLLYEQPLHAVLSHEVIRYNKLLGLISQSLGELTKALKGSVVMSSKMEIMALSLFNNTVPDTWKAKAYLSLKPLASWVSDLLLRISFLQGWISKGIPPVFWISGFFFPQALLTGTLQNYARRLGTAIETVGFDLEVLVKPVSEITEMPNIGCYIHGLFLEGACWNNETGRLTESKPMELHTQMPVIWLIPKANRRPPTSVVYLCPVYKTLRRAGTQSTSGLSNNYVTALELPTDQCPRHWIKRGVALICALDH
ncbi:dynein heavy chain 1, axonemal isoform X4 [Fundulus heteroclitus]|uniref:dynein heavy chain 1, axonemal isoform X4 n=1 Tax=Fundulus heteroclitus TaxID=8078 RepID=UPI00165BE702|nr:dynein heavy chain 1, axonemal isoform X4 [Fundulus heteroclitus]